MNSAISTMEIQKEALKVLQQTMAPRWSPTYVWGGEAYDIWSKIPVEDYPLHLLHENFTVRECIKKYLEDGHVSSRISENQRGSIDDI